MPDSPSRWQPLIANGMKLQFEPAQNGWVLLYPEGMVQLNQSAAEILRRCDGTRDIMAMIAELETQFNTTGIGPEVEQLIDEAKRRGWVV